MPTHHHLARAQTHNLDAVKSTLLEMHLSQAIRESTPAGPPRLGALQCLLAGQIGVAMEGQQGAHFVSAVIAEARRTGAAADGEVSCLWTATLGAVERLPLTWGQSTRKPDLAWYSSLCQHIGTRSTLSAIAPLVPASIIPLPHPTSALCRRPHPAPGRVRTRECDHMCSPGSGVRCAAADARRVPARRPPERGRA